jgi:hypothetical protein
MPASKSVDQGAKAILRGVTHFHSETGTEGGYWAFQDEKFMHLAPPTNNLWCDHCGRIWDKDSQDDEPKPDFSYLDVETGGQRGYDSPQDLPTSEEPGDFNDLWRRDGNAKSLDCLTSGHHWLSPQEQYPDDTWSYEGLHILRDGDHLTIWNEDRTGQLWDGEISFHQYPSFTEDACGLWIHADQDGVDRKTWSGWFLTQHPADLVPTVLPQKQGVENG